MKRIDAIKEIMNRIDKYTIVFSSCGMPSREVFHVKDRPRNFYVMGSMGCALSVAIGFAINKPKLWIVVILGDGDAIMGLDSLALLGYLQDRGKIENLKLYILRNSCYQSTGGQRCIDTDFNALCFCNVYDVFCEDSDVPRIPIPHEEITRRFKQSVNGI